MCGVISSRGCNVKNTLSFINYTLDISWNDVVKRNFG